MFFLLLSSLGCIQIKERRGMASIYIGGWFDPCIVSCRKFWMKRESVVDAMKVPIWHTCLGLSLLNYFIPYSFSKVLRGSLNYHSAWWMDMRFNPICWGFGSWPTCLMQPSWASWRLMSPLIIQDFGKIGNFRFPRWRSHLEWRSGQNILHAGCDLISYKGEASVHCTEPVRAQPTCMFWREPHSPNAACNWDRGKIYRLACIRPNP